MTLDCEITIKPFCTCEAYVHAYTYFISGVTLIWRWNGKKLAGLGIQFSTKESYAIG